MNTCPDCKCEFVQPFRCATCGAQKLYDHTVTSQQQTIDTLRALLDACAPYLKEGETPAERIERERKDLTATVGLLAAERRRNEDLNQQCRLGFQYREELRARVAELEAAEWIRTVTKSGPAP